MSIYKLTEYNDNYSKTPGGSLQYFCNEACFYNDISVVPSTGNLETSKFENRFPKRILPK